MKLNTRKLKANEIKAKVAKTNKGGVILLLWKSSLADLTILDEALDPSDYEITYPSKGVCRISIWDKEKGCWVSKEGIGEGNSPKSLANDSLMRAGIAWGIGRELYTANDIFIYKDKLKTYKDTEEDGKDVCVCYDEFQVLDILYQNDSISYLKIGIAQYGEIHHTVEFSFISEQKGSKATGKKGKEKSVKEPAKAESTSCKPSECVLPDDEIILMGNCRGKTFGEVRETEVFHSFLGWAKTATTRYADPKQAEQFDRIKVYAQQMCA